jgi:excisionase family DNA binding protein
MVVDVLKPPRPLTVAQVAHRLGCSPRAVQLLLEEKQLAGYRLKTHWRVEVADVEAFKRARSSRSSCSSP